MIYLMFFTSFDAVAHALGPANWRILHKFGLYWILIVFAQTLLPVSFDGQANVNWLLVVLTATALIIRLTAYQVKRRT